MGSRIGATLALALLASGARTQVVQYWAPAFSDVYGGVGTPKWYVFEGVPGERMQLRVHPQPPASSEAWVVELLQPDAPTKSFIAGPGGNIVLDEVVFGPAGVVAVNVRTFDGTIGGFVLRARAKLAPGSVHPAVNIVPGDPALASVDTVLRPGLSLRLRVRLPHQAQDWPTDALPQVLFTPAPLSGLPGSGYAELPDAKKGKPYPDVAKALVHAGFGPPDFGHIRVEVPLNGVTVLGARLKREKLIFGGYFDDGPGPSSADPAPPHSYPFGQVQLDQTELLPGSSAHLTASFFFHEDAGCPDQTATVQVWLSSLHRIDTEHLEGTLLAGPVEVPPAQYGTTFEADIQLPADIEPGLWGVWVVLDEADGPWTWPPACDNHYFGAAGATVLKVLAP